MDTDASPPESLGFGRGGSVSICGHPCSSVVLDLKLLASIPYSASLSLQVLAVHAHLLGRLGDVAAVARQRLGDEAALELLDDALLALFETAGWAGPARRGTALRRRGGERSPLAAQLRRQIVELNLVAGGQHRRLLDAVLELAHVARPVVREQRAIRVAARPASAGRPRRAAAAARKCSISGGTSSRRSRSGGMAIGTTLSR